MKVEGGEDRMKVKVELAIVTELRRVEGAGEEEGEGAGQGGTWGCWAS